MKLIFLEPDVVIAADMAETAREVFGQPEIRIVETIDDACAALAEDGATWSAMVLNGTTDELADARLRGLLEQSAVPAIVTTAGDLVELPAGWHALPMPFTSGDLATLLLRVVRPRRPDFDGAAPGPRGPVLDMSGLNGGDTGAPSAHPQPEVQAPLGLEAQARRLR
ncbi:hypothetical protein [Tropicimonas sediminicola]|uniref:Response regulatory domain-containing protein n=1 Tax=Tropicimonas sediminicola TaxID=1031541 RepID=A0A239KZ60_9RHOB|nr:hypothetical protein [Tropicimonas sediminicola]SNT23335.1 hypothetical protein SAMN05421757_108138 [Tropicimonas sediminicola]